MYTNNYKFYLPATDAKDFNVFFGLKGFYFTNKPLFNFGTDVSSQTLSIFSDNRYQQLEMAFFIITTYYCDYRTPYLFESNACYDVCPSNYFIDSQILKCSVCISEYSSQSCKKSGIQQTQVIDKIDGKDNAGMIAGIVVGVVSLLVIIGIICYRYKRSKRNSCQNEETTMGNPKINIYIDYDRSKEQISQSQINQTDLNHWREVRQ